jgi:TonB family protein
VVLTCDDAFLQTLREAVGSARRLWHVPSGDKVSDLLVAGEVGILVLDVHALNEAAEVFIAQIKRQFPDLVVVVAGNRDAETSIAALISAGIVYRFIHKPMSPGRAKLFADAAVKKFDEQRRSATASPLVHRTSNPKWGLRIGGAIAVLAVIAAVMVAMFQGADAPIGASHGAGTPRAPAGESPLLVSAAAALAANRLTEPPGDNALELYLQAQARNPNDSIARAGVAEVRERLLATAENALLEERLDEAAAAIEAARKAGVESGRIAFLSAQLGKSREQVKAAQASVRARNLPKAESDAVPPLLDLAAQRSNTAHLMEPAQDSAPLPAAAPRQADADAQSQLLKNVTERTQQDRLIEPENDNAKYYLMTLRGLDPNNPGLAAATSDLGTRLVAKARRALTLAQYDAARTWLDEAGAVGFSSPDAMAARRDLDAAVARQQFLDNIVAAGELTLVNSVTPKYPPKAESKKVQGWVELDFTVAENGAVKDVAVHATDTPGVFETAAIGALSQWRYKPVLRDSKPVPQRARIRIRFTLAG